MAFVASSATFACAAPGYASTVASVEAQAAASPATLGDVSTPVITYIAAQPGSGDGYTYTNYAMLVSDGTGSVDVFGHLPAGSSYVPTVGDAVSLSGTFSPFNGIPEIATLTAISPISSGNPVPGPIVTTIPQLQGVSTSENLGIEEYLVELDNVTFVNPPANYPIHANLSLTATDGTNSLIVFFNPSTYSSSAGLGGTPIPTGPVNITGIIDAFGGNYFGSPVGGTPELIPLTITAVPEPACLALMALGAGALLMRRK
jgi:hypothetical protein